MRTIILDLLNKLRYFACLPILLVIGFLTCPLTILFKWKGFWILCIASKDGCSLSEAKKIFLEGIKYPDIDKIDNSASLESNNDFDEIYTPAYSYLPSNVYHRNDN